MHRKAGLMVPSGCPARALGGSPEVSYVHQSYKQGFHLVVRKSAYMRQEALIHAARR